MPAKQRIATLLAGSFDLCLILLLHVRW